MAHKAVFNATFTESQNFLASFVEALNFAANFGEVINGHGGEPYTGPYEFTPTLETQTVAIANKVASQNIIINPIPSNYGLITWNGSTLTVS